MTVNGKPGGWPFPGESDDERKIEGPGAEKSPTESCSAQQQICTCHDLSRFWWFLKLYPCIDMYVYINIYIYIHICIHVILMHKWYIHTHTYTYNYIDILFVPIPLEWLPFEAQLFQILSIRQPRLWSNCSPGGFQDDRADLHTPVELAGHPFTGVTFPTTPVFSQKKIGLLGKEKVRIRSSSKKLDGMIWHNPSRASWLLISLSLKLCVFHWGIAAPIGYHTIPSGNAGFLVNLLYDPAPLPLKSFP